MTTRHLEYIGQGCVQEVGIFSAEILPATAPDRPVPQEEVDSIGHLFAAAPDLLAALKAINERINSLAQDGNKKPHTNDIRDWQRWSAAAIAKAEGRA